MSKYAREIDIALYRFLMLGGAAVGSVLTPALRKFVDVSPWLVPATLGIMAVVIFVVEVGDIFRRNRRR